MNSSKDAISEDLFDALFTRCLPLMSNYWSQTSMKLRSWMKSRPWNVIRSATHTLDAEILSEDLKVGLFRDSLVTRLIVRDTTVLVWTIINCLIFLGVCLVVRHYATHFDKTRQLCGRGSFRLTRYAFCCKHQPSIQLWLTSTSCFQLFRFLFFLVVVRFLVQIEGVHHVFHGDDSRCTTQKSLS